MLYLKFVLHLTKSKVASVGSLKGTKMALCEKNFGFNQKGY